MMLDRDASGPATEKSIDEAVHRCEKNITRHRYNSLYEAILALILLCIVLEALWLISNARLQEGNEKREVLKMAVQNAQADQDIQSKIQYIPYPEPPSLGRAQYEEEEKLRRAQYDLARKSAVEDTKRRVEEAVAALKSYSPPPAISEPIMGGAAAIFVMILGVFGSFHRSHAREISRLEHAEIGFMRIRIAANNKGFSATVQKSLTDGAFAEPAPVERTILGTKKVDSPLPGHPASDLMTGIANRVLEQLDVVVKPKGTKVTEVD